MQSRNHKTLYFIICLASLLTLFCAVSFAQDDAAPASIGYHEDDLTIQVTANNKAQVYLEAYTSPLLALALSKGLQETFHNELENVHFHGAGTPIEADSDTVRLQITADWSTPVLQKGLRCEGMLNLAPLLAALKRARFASLNVSVYLPPSGVPYCEGATQFAAYGRMATYAKLVPTNGKTGAVLRYGYGYDAGGWQRVIGILGAVLLLPIGAALFLRRRALTAKNANPTAVWFGFTQASGWIQTGFWPVWVGFLIWTRASDMVNFALHITRVGIASPGWVFLLFVPSGIVAVLIAAISQPVYARVRGIDMTSGSLAKRAAWRQALLYLPVNFTLYGVFSLSSAPQQAMFWFGASYVVRMVAAGQLAKLERFSPLPLTDGELRDYVFGLAQYAGVKIKNLILLPAAQMQEANAFAAANNTILVTDYLLQNMTKREVNAIMAHEMTHLKHKHAGNQQIIRLLCFYGPVFGLFFAQSAYPNSALDLPFWYPLAALCGLPIFTWFSRRDEKAADLGAAQMTGDPEAMISGLARLSHLSMHPQEWGRIASRFITHPSTNRRAQYLAEAWRVPAPRVKELLESPPDGERYATAEFVEETPRIYSLEWRQANSKRTLRESLAAMAAPLLAAGLIDQYTLMPPVFAILLYAAGTAASCAALVLVGKRAAMRSYIKLRPELLKVAQAKLIPGIEPVLTGFAPGGLPKSYGGNRDWDLGFLQIAPDELRYIGERTEFTLRRGDIVEMRLITTRTGWTNLPRLAISWRNTAQYASGVFNILPAESPDFAGTQRAIAMLTEQLSAWKLRPASETPAENLPALGLPFTGKANGANLKSIGSSANLTGLLMMMLITVGVASALCGLHFNIKATDEDGLGAGMYATICAAFVAVFYWIPASRYREPMVPQTPPAPPRPPEPAPAPPQYAAPSVPPLPARSSEFDFS